VSMFIRLEVDESKCLDPVECARCAAVCPVDIFRVEAARLVTVPENEDECTLCLLCLETCPEGAIRLVKLY
jgi:NAD-dependent dihydropyrimidine dehydrogenase PreA subunit